MEAALATVIIGVGVVASMELFAACTRQATAANRMTIALMLAGNIQEITQALAFNDPVSGTSVFGPEADETLATYDDVDDFDGCTFNPPIDAARQPLPQLAQYSQVVSVMPVYPVKPGGNTSETAPEIPKTAYTGACRVRVRVLFRARPSDAPVEVYRASWICLDR